MATVPNPYQAPATLNPGDVPPEERPLDVPRLAGRRDLLVACLVAQVLLGGCYAAFQAFVLDGLDGGAQRLAVSLVALPTTAAFLASFVVGAFSAVTLAFRLKPRRLGWLLPVLSVVPAWGLVAWCLIAYKATKAIRAHWKRVGVFGRAFPEIPEG